MFFQEFIFILCLLIIFIIPIKSTENCNIDYDRYKRSYGYSQTYHCSNLYSLSNDLLQTKDISEKKLPLKITKSPNLHIHTEICGQHQQQYLLGLLIESSYIHSIGSRAFSCRTLRVISISHTQFSLTILPDDIFLNAYQLQTIRLVNTNIKHLPSSLENLSNLTELILDDMHSLIDYPSIEYLSNLRYLHIFTSLNYFPLNYVDHLNRLSHIQIIHFGSRTINIFPKELFHLNGYQLTDVSLYSENITCRTCKSDWFKTIAKTLMIYGWTNRTKDQFRNKNFHLITKTTQFYKLDIIAYCGDMRLGEEPLMVHNAPLCCNKGYFQCATKRSTCQRLSSTFSRCKCLNGYYEDSYGDCISV
ncbi:unnamed protein product [Rotaria sordida]|uniref:EGF-like domain-containing protein n=1 Tax=Rotaria sordida TaxID=392033 RepID=A0A818QBH1_9BILA|nr:unnamed protein product [Rotaria sordida]CAF0760567.1 unnamed protein product [Rotaria sordida]CAF0776133.1 unnamed protein product [Rotaria sordida]CAF0778512.1 unnamed protein product [Rotaria sordida]CAF0781863.1 unnamed protein product [Rotaria sordida]